MLRFVTAVTSLVGLVLALGCAPHGPSQHTRVGAQPNILLIVADDLGYSDLGVYGGEIRTPNIDALAGQGVQFTQYYVQPTCSPTRAALMSGTDPHRVGLGRMAELNVLRPNRPVPTGYEGTLTLDLAALPERLRDAGYATLMTGKWHLGMETEQGPHARGFDRSFVVLDGGAHHFDESGVLPPFPISQFREDGAPVELPDDFYSTRFYTDKLIEYIDEPRDRPFFAYAAYTSPHWPLQVPDADLDLYKGRYDAGYEALRDERIARQRELGLLDSASAPAWERIPKWDTLPAETKRHESREMELYAAMVENLDRHVGRLIAHLRDTNQLENTIVVFMSDNGAAAEEPSRLVNAQAWTDWFDAFDNSLENAGRRGSYISYGPAWAQAGSGTLRSFKGLPTEGGVRVPMLLRMPGGSEAARRIDERVTVMDLSVTLADLAGAAQAGVNRTGSPVLGQSIRPLLEGRATALANKQPVGWELEGQRGIRVDHWKATMLVPPFGHSQWELFDLSTDPGEARNLATENPKQMQRMLEHWRRYTDENGIVVAP